MAAPQVPFALLVRAEAVLRQAVVTAALPADQRPAAALIVGELHYYITQASPSFRLDLAEAA